jgi:uncharacterized protein (DUF849 family)
MVAPNGARKTKEDHPNLPITISEIVKEAVNCFNEGANAIHAHVRDKKGDHCLDAGLYRELLSELDIKVPELPVQITTEAVGKFSPEEQFEVVKLVQPEAASVALIEMMPNIKDPRLAQNFYNFANENNVQIQHILYSVEDLKLFKKAIKLNVIPKNNLQVLYVLGRYDKNFQSKKEDLDLFLEEHKNIISAIDWGICAFGIAETDCLIKSNLHGGKVRVGFENNFYNQNGTLASSNAERVAEVSKLINS